MRVPAGATVSPSAIQVQEIGAQPSVFSQTLPPFVFAEPPAFQVSLPSGTLSQALTVTVRVYGASAGGQSPDRFALWQSVDGNSAHLSWAGGKVSSAGGQISLTAPVQATGTPTLLPTFNTASFSDLGSVPWARATIDHLLAAGILSGVRAPVFSTQGPQMIPGLFAPNAPVTRAQFAKMLDLAAGPSPVPHPALPFRDVSANAWYAPYVAALTQTGVFQGQSATVFAPNGLLTREQMAVVLTRLLPPASASPSPAVPSFTDANRIDGWAAAAVTKTVAAGILQGMPNGTFAPHAVVTRAQAAVALARYLALVGKL